MIKQLKVNQKVLLICQEVIGTVVDVNNELNKVVIRAEKNSIPFDFIVTTEGFLPFSDVTMIEEIPFIENETVVKVDSSNSTYRVGEITEIHLNDEKELVGIFGDTAVRKTVLLNECRKLSELIALCTAKEEANKMLYHDNYLPGNNGGQTTQGEEE